MNAEKLLDAFGMVDDRFFASEEKPRTAPLRKRRLILIAAILMFALSIGTAVAVSPDLQELIFTIFHIETHEQPPAGNADSLPTQNTTAPSQPGLRQLDVVSIDGVVYAHYFTGEGIVLTYEGGFYTCTRSDANSAPEDAAFWEIRTEGIVNVGATRVAFPLVHGDRTIPILFDYGILNGKLSIKVWPQNMNENPIGNGWNLEPIADRTDVALLTVPVHTDRDYTHDFLLLDLMTLETTDLLEAIPHDDLIIDAFRITDNLRYAILTGVDRKSGGSGYWFCDLERHTVTTLDALTETEISEPYFLNDDTIIFHQPLGEGRFNVVRYHIPTGAQTVIIENTTGSIGGSFGYRGIRKNGGNGAHGLLFCRDGSVELVDFQTGTRLAMTGLDTEKLTTSESPDGTRIMIASEETNESGELGYGFSRLGVLNPETGVLQMLTRDISGNPETFWGWLDNDTLVITAHSAAGGYYVYVYAFQT